MSLYGDAIAAIRSVILIDERVQSVAAKVDRLADDVRDMRERLVRIETIVEVTRNGGRRPRTAASAPSPCKR